jgi:hypothetical protein
MMSSTSHGQVESHQDRQVSAASDRQRFDQEQQVRIFGEISQFAKLGIAEGGFADRSGVLFAGAAGSDAQMSG